MQSHTFVIALKVHDVHTWIGITKMQICLSNVTHTCNYAHEQVIIITVKCIPGALHDIKLVCIEAETGQWKFKQIMIKNKSFWKHSEISDELFPNLLSSTKGECIMITTFFREFFVFVFLYRAKGRGTRKIHHTVANLCWFDHNFKNE